MPAGKKTTLVLDVAHNPRGDWTQVVRTNGETLSKHKISKDTSTDGWKTVTVDLSPMAGQAVSIELANSADGWRNEAGYWAKIAIE